MSKETYLKGEGKEKVLNLIKHGMTYRLTNQEILEELATRGFDMSERTLRRYKLDIHEDSGTSLWSKFRNQVIGNILEDILSYEEMQKKCWEIFVESKNNNERLRALSCLRGVSSDKIKILNNVPKGIRGQSVNYEAIRQSIKASKEAIKEAKKLTKPRVRS